MGCKSKSLDTYIEFLGKREDYKFYWQTKAKLLSQNFITKLASKNVSFKDHCIKKWQNSNQQL